MELRRNRILKRRLKNNLPQYNKGAEADKPKKPGADWGGMITNAVSFTGSTIGAFSGVKTPGEIQAESRNETGYGSGFSYNKIGAVNLSALMQELDGQNMSNAFNTIGTGAALGASIGTLGGPLGTAIGAAAGTVIGGAIGIFGGASRKSKMLERIRKANENINNLNLYNLASAQSDYLQNLYQLDYGNTQGGQLYSANRGKDLIKPKR